MNDAILIQSIAVAIVAGTPLVLAGTGEILTQRSGILNLGVEGMMLMGAVTGFWATTEVGNPWVGLVVGMAAGSATGLIHGVLAVRLHANQIVTGIGLVIFGTGISRFIGDLGEDPRRSAVGSRHVRSAPGGWIGRSAGRRSHPLLPRRHRVPIVGVCGS